MATVLEAVSFTNPNIPIVSNVTAQPLVTSDQLAIELHEQITSPVLWVDSLRTMLSAGVNSFIEFGPGRVLSGTVGRTDRSSNVRNVTNAADARGVEGEE
jgi:[acyl-carrier-protein] S-malonyltransferase